MADSPAPPPEAPGEETGALGPSPGVTGRGGGPGIPRWLRLALQVGLTVGLTLLLVDRLGVGIRDALALERALPAPRLLPLSLSIPLLLGAFYLAARLWGRMVGELGGPDPGGWASFRIVMVANLGRYIPGKLWPLAGLALLSRRKGIPASTGTTSGLLVQGFSLAGAAVLGLPALLRALPGWEAGGPGGLGGGSMGSSPGAAGLLAVALLLVLVGVASLPAVTGWGIRLLFRLAGRPSTDAPRPGISFGPRWLLWHLVVWAAYGLAFAVFLRGLGFDVPVLEAAPAFTAAYLLGYVALFAPAGIGIREGFLIAFLQPALGGSAAAVAVLARLWMTAVELLPAGILAAREITGPGTRRGGRGGEGHG